MDTLQRVIHGYVHSGRIGVLVEFGVESEFTTRHEEFVRVAHEIAMHIAASAPSSPQELLAQPFVKDPSITVRQLLAAASGKLHEPLTVTRLVRWDTSVSVAPLIEPPTGPAVAFGKARSA